MSVIVFCVFLCISGCFRGSSADIQDITKKPGDDVTLMCKDPEKKEISLLEWSRNDSEILFVFKDGRPSPSVTHKSYRNRVFLKDSQMKDGDLSVVLKNVTMNDTGTYQCRVKVKTKRSILKTPPICIIHLSVVPPGDPSPGEQGGRVGDKEGKEEDGGTRKEGLGPGEITGIVLSVLLVTVILPVGLWIYWKKKGPNLSSSGSNNQQNPEQDRLNSDP